MSLETLPGNLGLGGAHLNKQVLHAILQELRGIKFNAAAGAATDTNIAVSGIAVEDTLVGVLEIDIAGDAVADRLSESSITSAGNIQLTTTTTTGSFLLIIWMDKNP